MVMGAKGWQVMPMPRWGRGRDFMGVGGVYNVQCNDVTWKRCHVSDRFWVKSPSEFWGEIYGEIALKPQRFVPKPQCHHMTSSA